MAQNSGNWSTEPWNDSQMLECSMVVPENDDTATFAFRAPDGAWFDYQPGQFLTFDLPAGGQPDLYDFLQPLAAAVGQRRGRDNLVPRPGATAWGQALHRRGGPLGGGVYLRRAADPEAPLPWPGALAQ